MQRFLQFPVDSQQITRVDLWGIREGANPWGSIRTLPTPHTCACLVRTRLIPWLNGKVVSSTFFGARTQKDDPIPTGASDHPTYTYDIIVMKPLKKQSGSKIFPWRSKVEISEFVVRVMWTCNKHLDDSRCNGLVRVSSGAAPKVDWQLNLRNGSAA